MLQPRKIVDICSPHYIEWKEKALNSETNQEMKDCLNRAFFWLELQNNLLILWTIENTNSNDPVVKKQVLKAKENINQKIAEYTDDLVKKFNF